MLLTFQDRLRIPWRGGAKRISVAAIIPAITLPLVMCVAAVNAYTSIIIFLSSSVFMGYFYRYVRNAQIRTRFFFMWLFWSIVYMIVLFECMTPLLSLLPEENFILALLASGAFFCLYRTKKRSQLNIVVQSDVAGDELPDITEVSAAEEEHESLTDVTTLLLELDEEEDVASVGAGATRRHPGMCAFCHKYVPARTAHCSLCSACILRYDHHSYWLDCCVGEWNHRYYVTGLALSALALLWGVNLTLTAVCHPIFVARLLHMPLLLPDDCSEVFYVYDMSLSFVGAMYGLLMAVYILVALLRQIYSISRGVTLHERENGLRGNRLKYWLNWKRFLW